MRLISLFHIFLAIAGLSMWSCTTNPTSTTCTTNADCPNATCETSLGICVSTQTPPTARNTEFPKDQIYYCLESKQCPTGLKCNQGICAAKCSAEEDCAAQQSSCLASRVCGHCEKNSDCFEGLVCKEKRCVPCEKDEQCEKSEYCETSTKLCSKRCATRGECPEGWVCKEERCLSCAQDNECAKDEVCLPIASNNGSNTTQLCTPGCRTSQQCASPTPHCDTTKFACVACLNETHCGTDGLLCKHGACVVCQPGDCPQGSFCVEVQKRCIPNGCNHDKDCNRQGMGTYCDPASSTCVECFDAAHCTQLQKGVRCENNRCKPCEKDADCGPQQICYQATCKGQTCRTHLDCLLNQNDGSTGNQTASSYCSKDAGKELGECKACKLPDCAKNICMAGDPTCVPCANNDDCKNFNGGRSHCFMGLGICLKGQCSTWDECFDTPPSSEPFDKLCLEQNCKACDAAFGDLKSTGVDVAKLQLAYEGQNTQPFVWETSVGQTTARNLFFQWKVTDPPPGLTYTSDKQSTPVFSMHGTFSHSTPPGKRQEGKMLLSLLIYQIGFGGRRIVCKLDKEIPWTIWPKLEQAIAGQPNAHPTLPMVVWRPYDQGQPSELNITRYVKGGGVNNPQTMKPSYRCSLYRGAGQGIFPNIFEGTNSCTLKRKSLVSRPNGYFGFLVSVEDTLGQKIEIPFLVIPSNCTDRNRSFSGPDPTNWQPLTSGKTAKWSMKLDDVKYQLFGGSRVCGVNFNMNLETPLIANGQPTASSALSCAANSLICMTCPTGCNICSNNLCRDRNAPGVCIIPVGVEFRYEVELRPTPPQRPGQPGFLTFALKHNYNTLSSFSCYVSLFEPASSTPLPVP